MRGERREESLRSEDEWEKRVKCRLNEDQEGRGEKREGEREGARE